MKLNLGCGNDIQAGYVNIDFNASSPDVIVHDLNNPLPYEDGSADEIRAIDIVEHFNRLSVISIITDWVRVLKPGGGLILQTPDIKLICERYYPAAKSGQISWEKLSAVIHGGQEYEGNFHEVSFSFEWLRDILSDLGMNSFHKREHENQNMTITCLKQQTQYEEYLNYLNSKGLKQSVMHRVLLSSHSTWVANLAETKKFDNILEIGRSKGHSLGLFKYLWPESRVVSIDIERHPESEDIVELFSDRGEIKLIDGDITALNEDTIFDLVLIDGDHTYAGAKKDWLHIQNNIAPGTIVLVDDLDHGQGCGGVFYEVRHLYEHECVINERGNEGLGVLYI